MKADARRSHGDERAVVRGEALAAAGDEARQAGHERQHAEPDRQCAGRRRAWSRTCPGRDRSRAARWCSSGAGAAVTTANAPTPSRRSASVSPGTMHARRGGGRAAPPPDQEGRHRKRDREHDQLLPHERRDECGRDRRRDPAARPTGESLDHQPDAKNCPWIRERLRQHVQRIDHRRDRHRSRRNRERAGFDTRRLLRRKAGTAAEVMTRMFRYLMTLYAVAVSRAATAGAIRYTYSDSEGGRLTPDRRDAVVRHRPRDTASTGARP